MGTTVYSGGNGGNGAEGDADGGGGGGAAGSTGQGSNGSTVNGGGPQLNYGGFGGNGGDDGAYGSIGGNYGGGGGGSSANGSQDRDGGPGSVGTIVLTWCEVLSINPEVLCPNDVSNVVISGSNFVDVDSVLVNGTSVFFTVDSPTQITVTDLLAATSGAVLVYTKNGHSIAPSMLTIFDQNVSVSIDQGGSTLTAQYTGGPGETYQWIDCLNGNQAILGATDSVYFASINGLYAVVVSEGGCEMNSACESVTAVGLTETKASINIYPIPSKGFINIQFDSENYEIQVFDADGRLLLNEWYLAGKTRIDLNHLNSGIYFVNLLIDELTYISRIIISK